MIECDIILGIYFAIITSKRQNSFTSTLKQSIICSKKVNRFGGAARARDME